MSKFERSAAVGTDEYAKALLLPRRLRYELSLVVPSLRGKMLPQYPVRLHFEGGRVVERALLVDAFLAYRVTGLWSAALETYQTAPLEGVVGIEESGWRMPPKWANYVYEHEEAFMGSYEFRLEGPDLACVVRPGGIVDYPDVPDRSLLTSIQSVAVSTGSARPSPSIVGTAEFDTYAFRRV